ncbi:MAG: DUF2306 domain-containing protein [Nocardioides sp.]
MSVTRPTMPPTRPPTRPPTTTRLRRRARAGLGAATLGCLLIGGYGAALAASGFRLLPADVAANGFGLALRLHVVTSSVALLLVPWQLWPALRRRPRLHRWLGRGYVLAAVAGGVSGFAAALFTANGAIAAAGFAVLGVLWTTTTLAAYAAARRRDLRTHRRWAVRSFALAFAAVTLRLLIPLAMSMDFTFAATYPLVAWLCWIPNLALAEWHLRRTARRASE